MAKPSRSRLFGGMSAIVAVLAGVLPSLCCSDAVTSPSDLTGGVWRLRSMELAGASQFVPDDPNRFTVEFHADGRIGVVADCNLCGGSYWLSGATLTVRDLACTLALCATPGGGEFANLVEGTSTLDKAGDQLTIRSAEGKLVLRR